MEGLKPDDPRTMGDYQLLARLGAGGMGQVYLGRSPGGRMVAVKLVHTGLAKDAMFRRRFRREVEAARRVGGQWTAPVLDAETESETPWVATGYVPGPTLADTVERHGPLPERSVLALASGLVRALQAVHGCGLIHRDIKPSNVLVTIDGPRLIDFGIVRSVDASVATRTGALIGSPAFMSPEQARGNELGPASDVFSLGSVLAYAATGRQPFGAGLSGVHAVLLQVAQGDPQLGGLSGPVRALVEACLAKVPEQRPPLGAILERLPPPSNAWLPGEVVTELGRHAAALLDLESPELHMAPAPPSPAGPPADATMDGMRDNALTKPSHHRPASRRWLYPAVAVAAGVALFAAGTAVARVGGSGDDSSGQGAGTGKGEGVVPPAMLGTWEGDYDTTTQAGNPVTRYRRITLTQGKLGADVATIRVSTDKGERGLLDRAVCEYVARLAAGSPVVELRPRLTRSTPPGRCEHDPPQTMKMNGTDIRWAARRQSSRLTRARNNAIPVQFHGRWAGTDPRGVRRVFTIRGGTVGSEAIQIKLTTPGGAPLCEMKAVLVSADSPIIYLPIRFTKPNRVCALGEITGFQLEGQGLVWGDGQVRLRRI
ncbi:serine/threonine-protein kinase [Actinomadura sp. 7K507]|uniref:serine/threonine-protein kinase n=1 Tax=Actinomadura sp. 7K507 TaxID=2530365 RepID=UPI001A9FB04E|nr:serine/threonine-protein kinase [Actinomadura sp. 7K507]